MTKSGAAIEITEEQALFFRARRGGLAGPGHTNALKCVRAILGAQSQQLGPSLLAISQRTKGRPTADKLSEQLLEQRKFVRTWGQRGTIHVYDPADWPLINAGRKQWTKTGRAALKWKKSVIDKAVALAEKQGGQIVRADVLPLVPDAIAETIDAKFGTLAVRRRFAAGFLLWELAWRGFTCAGPKRGAEQTYVLRDSVFPDLEWPTLDPDDASTTLTERYLAVSAPATLKDVAHFFGASITDTKPWLTRLAPKLVDVECGGRKGLFALKKDAKALQEKPPTKAADWPLRLLPLWDCLLMSHADKSWTVPHEPDKKLIWRKSAYVTSVALHRGRAVANWNFKERAKEIDVAVDPLSGWSQSKHLAALKREAAAIATHVGRAKAAFK